MNNRVAIIAVIGLLTPVAAFFVGKSQQKVVYLHDSHSMTLSQENALLRSQLLAYQLKENRDKVLANAHLIGVALVKYIVAHDKAPSTAEVAAGCLIPYEEGNDIISGLLDSKRFAYLYPGSPIDAVNFPRSAEVGYLYGNGGKVHLYMDGSVHWGTD